MLVNQQQNLVHKPNLQRPMCSFHYKTLQLPSFARCQWCSEIAISHSYSMRITQWKLNKPTCKIKDNCTFQKTGDKKLVCLTFSVAHSAEASVLPASKSSHFLINLKTDPELTQWAPAAFCQLRKHFGCVHPASRQYPLLGTFKKQRQLLPKWVQNLSGTPESPTHTSD